MKYVLQAAIFLLMVSVGMGLSLPELRISTGPLKPQNWRLTFGLLDRRSGGR